MHRHVHPIRYEDIETLPASKLMELTSSQLTTLIKQAERRIDKAQAVKNWLTWIKREKYLKDIFSDTQEGGAA